MGVSLYRKWLWVIRYMFVVIIVVVWMSVEIGVGFVIVLGS